ncbi:14587_t:CDS:1, partial [Dentiscutata erythropus]
MKKEEFFEIKKKYRTKITFSDDLLDDIIGLLMCNYPQNIKKSPFRLGNYQKSQIIKNYQDFLEISSWIDNDKGKNSFRFDLIFDNTFFGSNFNVTSFHTICNGTFSTITFFDLNGLIVGGYNPLGWSNDNKYKSSDCSFIFAYNGDNLKNTTISRAIENGKVIGQNKNYGPWFGEGPDLVVRHNAKQIEMKSKTYNKLFDLEGNYPFRNIEVFK